MSQAWENDTEDQRDADTEQRLADAFDEAALGLAGRGIDKRRITRNVVKPPVTYQRLPRVAARLIRAAPMAMAITTGSTPSAASRAAATAPAVTLIARPAPRSLVISAVGRITSRHAAVAQPT